MEQYNKIVLENTTDKAKYFTKITVEDREKVKEWLEKQTNAPEWAKKFLDVVQKAVQVVDYDYWIANLEPSVKDGKIYYAKGEDVGVGYSCKDWKKMAKKYAPEKGSRLSNLYELFIWYALRIVNGLWTLKYVTCDSSSAGNYWNAPSSSKKIEKTGARKSGGYKDGQGNTYKIVNHEDGFASVGGYYFCNGYDDPVADFGYYYWPDEILDHSSGVLVLTK